MLIYATPLLFSLDGTEFIDERTTANPEFLGRVRAIATTFFKGGNYRRSLHLRESADACGGVVGGQGSDLWRQVLGQNHVATA